MLNTGYAERATSKVRNREHLEGDEWGHDGIHRYITTVRKVITFLSFVIMKK